MTKCPNCKKAENIEWALLFDSEYRETFREMYNFFPDPYKPYIFKKAVNLLMKEGKHDKMP